MVTLARPDIHVNHNFLNSNGKVSIKIYISLFECGYRIYTVAV